VGFFILNKLVPFLLTSKKKAFKSSWGGGEFQTFCRGKKQILGDSRGLKNKK
jgi:hypothetical protein